MKRIAWVDLTETIAISMVVLYHCTAYIANFDFIPNSGFGFYLFYFLRSILSACVPLFFLINGYLLFRHNFTLKKHLFKTFKFIFLALFWYVFTLTVMLLVTYNPDQGLASNLGSIKTDINHLWYLGALVCLYFFFPLLKIVYDHSRTVFIYFTIICAVFVFGNSLINQLATLLTDNLYLEVNFFRIFNPLRGIYGFSFVYFCLGGILHLSLAKIQSYPRKKLNLIAIISLIIGILGQFAIGLLYSLRASKIWDNVWNGYDTLPTLLITLSIIGLCFSFQHQSRILTTISKNTLGIYLIHMIIISTFLYLARPFIMAITNPLTPELPTIATLLTTVIYAIVVFVVSLATSSLWRKIPIIKHLIS